MIAEIASIAAPFIANSLMGSGDSGSDYLRQGIDQYNRVIPPTEEELKAKLQSLVYSGDLTVEQAQSIMQDPSLLQSMSVDPTGIAAQKASLAKLQDISNQGGLTAEDLSQLSQIQSRNSQAERGSREAVLQNAQERGVSGSGLELASQLLNQQSGATRNSQEGLGVAAQAQKRALEALATSGTMGGQMNQQAFNESSTKAAAQDAINKFNTQTSNTVNMANTDSANAATARNLETKQNISNQNVGLANTQATNDAAARQQAYANAMAKASGISGQLTGLATNTANQSANERAQLGNLLSTSGQIYGNYVSNKKNPSLTNENTQIPPQVPSGKKLNPITGLWE